MLRFALPLTRFLAALALLGLLAALSPSQLDPPAEPTPISVSATEGKRVRGLSYDASVTGGQSATFGFSIGNQPGATGIVWSVDGTAIPSAQNSTSCSYKAVGVGKHSVSVKVSFPGQPVSPGGLTFAAIGGPLDYSVFNAESGVSVPMHDDNDSTHPFHLQYFDYTYAGSSSKPTGAQQPQCGSSTPVLSQLTGTTYTWTITGPGQNFATGLNGSTVFVTANGQSASGEIKARLTYSYTEPTDSSLTGSALDDSEETPPPSQTVANASYYSFTAHRPTRVETLKSQTDLHQTGGVYSSTSPWTYQDRFFHKLYDHNSVGQPGVWVTERFPDAASAISAWNAATGQSITMSNAGTNGTNFDSIYGGSFEYGEIQNLDVIGLQGIVANASHPDPATYPALIFTQRYYAGTHTTTLAAWGILVQNWTNTCKTTSVKHEKS